MLLVVCCGCLGCLGGDETEPKDKIELNTAGRHLAKFKVEMGEMGGMRTMARSRGSGLVGCCFAGTTLSRNIDIGT